MLDRHPLSYAWEFPKKMPHRIKYTQKDQFINRTKELDFLAQWINRKPQHILFIYGTSSSCRSTGIGRFFP